MTGRLPKASLDGSEARCRGASRREDAGIRWHLSARPSSARLGQARPGYRAGPPAERYNPTFVFAIARLINITLSPLTLSKSTPSEGSNPRAAGLKRAANFDLSWNILLTKIPMSFTVWAWNMLEIFHLKKSAFLLWPKILHCLYRTKIIQQKNTIILVFLTGSNSWYRQSLGGVIQNMHEVLWNFRL